MNLSKSKIFLVLCLSFIIGIFLGRFLNYETMAVMAMVFIIVATVGWSNKLAIVIGFAGLVLLAGATRFKLDYQQNDLAQFYGQKISAEAVIKQEPDVRPDKTYLTLGDVSIDGKKLKSQILATVNNFPQYEYGQKISFEVKITEPKEFPDFSYKNYLSRFGIDAVGYYPKITLVPGQYGNPVKRRILLLKEKFVDNINRSLSEPQASFLGGLLLGAKHSIPQELIDAFNATGTSHIIAVSGYNITIIADAISALLGYIGLRKRFSFFLSLLAIAVFVIMTGASASVIRAGLMGALLLVALNIGRVYAVTNALTLTAVVMLAINPQILSFDVGFQLSFAALLGIIYFTPIIEPYFLWVPKFIRPYLLATICAQLFTLPILLINFGLLSLIAVPVNVLVMVAVPITMLFGFLTGMAGFVWIKLALPLAAISWVLLSYIIRVVEFASRLPFASVQFNFNIYWFVIYYVIIAGVLYYHYQWKPRQKNFSSI